jgi:hypothetical protein
MYEGEWKNDNPNGKGTFTWPDGDRYVGEFKDWDKNGRGTYTSPDGRKYVGEFKDDRPHGQGTYCLSDGRKFEGEYDNGNECNGETFDKEGKVISIYVNGKDEKQYPPLKLTH